MHIYRQTTSHTTTMDPYTEWMQAHHCPSLARGWECLCDIPYMPESIPEKQRIDAELAGIIKNKVAKAPKQPVPEAPLPAPVVDKYAPYESLYELTLTTTQDDPYELRTFFSKIVNSAMYEVKGYIACIELQANGNPHIHALLFSKRKYCDGTKIKKTLKFPYRYTMTKVKKPGNYYEYIHKEAGNEAIALYCEQKGIPQHWESA